MFFTGSGTSVKNELEYSTDEEQLRKLPFNYSILWRHELIWCENYIAKWEHNYDKNFRLSNIVYIMDKTCRIQMQR